MAQVKIGPKFFAKAFNDYSDWTYALAREAIQNSVDAPHSSRISVDIKHEGDNTRLIWDNNGDPMTEDILVDKFLALGESGKDFQDGSVGGFGKAKEILVMCHLSYEITTGSSRAVGSGGTYELSQCDYHDGTRMSVLVAGDRVSELEQEFRNLFFLSTWNGVYFLNGEERLGQFNKGTKKKEFTWAKVYTNKTIENQLIVRIHGIPMFRRRISCNGRCVVVELKKGNADVLQSNRDSLKWAYQSQLDAFIDDITVNKRSALDQDRTPKYFHYDGEKLKSSFSSTQKSAAARIQEVIDEAYATITGKTEVSTDEDPQEAVPAGVDAYTTPNRPELADAPIAEYNEVCSSLRKSQITSDFTLKNELGMETPLHYLPTHFSTYALNVVKIWTKALLRLHSVFKKEDQFGIGYVLTEDSEAEFDNNDKFGKIYLLNPCKVVMQKASKSRSLSKRFKLTPAGRWQIVAIAAHEFIHGALGIGPHDEEFARTLTDVLGVLLRERQSFNACFR